MRAAIDSSVLIAFGKLGYLKLIAQLFDKFVVAESVFEEIRADQVFSEVEKLVVAGSIEVLKGSNYELLTLLMSSLGRGEAETIVLALELKADFALLDDLRARKAARRLKVKVMGTLALLKALLDLKLVNETPQDLCSKLIIQGFWLDAELGLRTLKGNAE